MHCFCAVLEFLLVVAWLGQSVVLWVFSPSYCGLWTRIFYTLKEYYFFIE